MAIIQSESSHIRQLVKERRQSGPATNYIQPISTEQVADGSIDQSKKNSETQMGTSQPIPAVTITAEGETLLRTKQTDDDTKDREFLRTREEPPNNINILIYKTIMDHLDPVFEQLNDDVFTLPALPTRIYQLIESSDPLLNDSACIATSLLLSDLIQNALVCRARHSNI